MNWMGQTYFYACAALAIAGALATISAKTPVRGAMGLLLVVLSMAGLFLALHAQFLAAVQLIVYAGAIVVLFMFVVMLLGERATFRSDGRGFLPRAIAATLFGLGGIGAMALIARGGELAALTHPPESFGGVDAVGRALFSEALVPFELSSALLLVAILGAVAVAKGRKGEPPITGRPAEAIEKAEKEGVA